MGRNPNPRTGFRCPRCGARTDVNDSRQLKPQLIVRRRKCTGTGCHARFTTYEGMTSGAKSMVVQKVTAERIENAIKKLADVLEGLRKHQEEEDDTIS